MREKRGSKITILQRLTREHPLHTAGIILALLILIICSAGCTGTDGSPAQESSDTWKTFELTDVRTGTVFSLSSFDDHPVLIQTFTITCPVCMRQQEEITRLHDSGTVPFVMVGLDIDPNGNSGSLRSYTDRQGYYGLYARSPPEMTRLLADRFGIPVLSPAQAPLILICPDGNATLLPSGIKTTDDLEKALSGCG
jgi:thiol-disulfide isomerase/thioredoxin